MNNAKMKYLFGVVPAVLIIFCSNCSTVKETPRYSVEGITEEYTGGRKPRPTPNSRAAHGKTAAVDKEISFPLNLSQAIDLALTNNHDLNRAKFRIAQAKAMQDLANATFLPYLGVYAEYMQGDAPSAYLFKKIDQRKLPMNVNFNDPGWFENYETGVKAQLNLFNRGQDYLARRMAKQEVEISILDRKSTTNRLVARIIQAFYDILAAQKYLQIAESSVAAVSRQLELMQVRYEGGAVLKSELLSLKVRLSKSKEETVRAQNRLQLAKTNLSQLLGLDPEVFSNREKPLIEPANNPVTVPEEYETVMRYALARRPEIDKIRKQLIKSRMGVDHAQSEYLPKLDLVAKYYRDDPEMDFDRDRENWTAALMLSWDLFTGLSTSARISHAKAALQELMAADQQAVLNIKVDVERAYFNRKAAQAAYQAAESSRKYAEESYRLVAKHYKGGAATVTRYLETELDHNRAQIRFTAAYYDKIKAAADLARATGKWADKQIANTPKGSDSHGN